jgi:hypothetical protein
VTIHYILERTHDHLTAKADAGDGAALGIGT